MFGTRLISGIILVLLAVAVILTGGAVLAGILLAVSLIAFRELTKACGVSGENGRITALEIAGGTVTVLYYVALAELMEQHGGIGLEECSLIVSGFVVLSLLVFLFLYVFTFPKYRSGQIMAALFSFLYAPVMLSFLYLIREGFAQGRYLVWFVFLCSWGSDTCAYAVGVLFGKHKMSPKLSPKKSIEGAVGGVLGAALLMALYTHFVINAFTEVELSPVTAAVLGVVGALVSMVGDLAASAIKRDHGIKDYGKLIPGHGGIMDRFDSVIITTPLVLAGLIAISRLAQISL